MELSDLLKHHYLIPTKADCRIGQLVTDSRKVQEGDVFVALKGTQVDGAQYVQQAIEQDACAILIDADSTLEPIKWQQGVPLIPIYQLQQNLGEIAARYYGYPSKKLRIIGVTGTNGKTSCSHFLAQMLNAFGVRCGIIGTLGCGFYGDLHETGFTTPDAVTLQSILHQFVKKGAQAVAMEVSSHAIHQGRINGIEFETGIFTNLTQDHLDYHGTMENYAAVKFRYLADFPITNLVINADDAYGAKWLQKLVALKKVFPYSVKQNTKNIELSLQGVQADVSTEWGNAKITLPVVGDFNLSNALAVINTLCLMGYSINSIAEKMKQLTPVPGRMQTIFAPGFPLVVVDFAHTPDALEKVLQTLRSHSHGKLICVFGCGGDRDQTKRPLMGAMVEKYADIAIITNDNPRHEQPEVIAKAIQSGFAKPDSVQIELDRSKAIKKSIQLATANDCILIAGKGAERYQQIGDEKFPFSDVEQAQMLIKEVNEQL